MVLPLRERGQTGPARPVGQAYFEDLAHSLLGLSKRQVDEAVTPSEIPPVHETEHDTDYLDGAGGDGQLGIFWADGDAFYQLPGEIQSRATDAGDPGGLTGQPPDERSLQEPSFLILTALAGGAQHGYGIMADVVQISEGRVKLQVGTLYAALDRLAAERRTGLTDPADPRGQKTLSAVSVILPLILLPEAASSFLFGWLDEPQYASFSLPGIGIQLVAQGQLILVILILLRLRRIAALSAAIMLIWWVWIAAGSWASASPVAIFYLLFYGLEISALLASPGPRRGLQLLTSRRRAGNRGRGSESGAAWAWWSRCC